LALEKLKSFDEFLARRFPESRRKAYYLMSIREQLVIAKISTHTLQVLTASRKL
jgi:hypothetical protein